MEYSFFKANSVTLFDKNRKIQKNMFLLFWKLDEENFF